MNGLICMNTLCKAGDPETRCPHCSARDLMRCGNSNTYCRRCGHALVLFDKEVIDRAASNALETPMGEVIDFDKCFGFEQEN